MTKLHIFTDQTGSERSLESRAASPRHSPDGPQHPKGGITDPATAEIVHDFRNLLGTIHGLADLAFLELLDNSGATLRMEEIRVACREGGELCQQMLTQSPDALARLDNCDLAQVVQGMEMQLRVCISGEFDLELDLDPAPLLAPAHGRLQRIVLNLVKNAAQSLGGRPGVVRIRTGMSTAHIGDNVFADAPLIGGRPPTPFLIVSDTGRGMDEGRRTSLVNSSARAARSGGHGLGFASVRRMVKSCGGAIRISSEPGQGTTVLVAFPYPNALPEDIVVDARLNMRPVNPE